MQNNRYYAVVKKTDNEITHHKYYKKEQLPDGRWRYYYRYPKEDGGVITEVKTKNDPYLVDGEAAVDFISQPIDAFREMLYEESELFKKFWDLWNTPISELIKYDKKIVIPEGKADELNDILMTKRNRR